MTSGQRLRKAMRENGWSKTRLSKVSGLSYDTITRMCNGNNNGYVDTWVKACNTMGISLYDVLQGDGIDG